MARTINSDWRDWPEFPIPRTPQELAEWTRYQSLWHPKKLEECRQENRWTD